MSEKPVSKITLKNGSEVKTYTKPVLEKNMVAIKDRKGRKILISKTLIDWEMTREASQDIYQLAYPEKAKVWLANRKPEEGRQKKPKKKIVINNDLISAMEPNEGLASEWKGDQSQGQVQASKKAPVSNKPLIETVRGAQKLDLKQHMVPGKLVIFDFYANWCGPCRKLTPQLENLVRKYPNEVALKKIDIQRWGTPVANQFGIRSIPYVEVYDSKGKQKMKGNGFKVLRDLQNKARKDKW